MLRIKGLSLFFPHKICFEGFETDIPHCSRIAILGRNGSGKSSLLKMLAGLLTPQEGEIILPTCCTIGYVPQMIEEYAHLSGGQRFQEALTAALSLKPDLLLLDEPTNHLDPDKRQSLIRYLQSYTGTLMVASHDRKIYSLMSTLWHIDQGKIRIFEGRYEDYCREISLKRTAIEQSILQLTEEKKQTHQALMKEQERAKKKKAYGEKKYDGDKIALRSAQGRGEMTHNKNKKAIQTTKAKLMEELSDLNLPENITPHFHFTNATLHHKPVLTISNGSIAYWEEKPILTGIYLSLGSQSRMAIKGPNGSGKSTLIKAILNDPAVIKKGEWYTPQKEEIGYLDQHYDTLPSQKTVINSLSERVPTWSYTALRKHLNDFLFRKNEEVNAPIASLSGGEKARLSLAHIAANTPKLLILDEITNNLDLETYEHVIAILKDYPSALLVISHDEDFLEKIGVSQSLSLSPNQT